MFSAAQQLLCACITADMRSPNTCCASVSLLVGDIKKSPYPPSKRLAGESVGTDVAYHTVFPQFILLKRSFSSLYAVFRDKNAIFAV